MLIGLVYVLEVVLQISTQQFRYGIIKELYNRYSELLSKNCFNLSNTAIAFAIFDFSVFICDFQASFSSIIDPKNVTSFDMNTICLFL